LPEAWREVRIGLDVHVLNGPSQGTASSWSNLLRHLSPLHEYRLYSFDPALTARLFPEPHFVHCRIPIHQPHVRIQLVYPWLARRDHCDVFHVNYYGPLLGAPGLVVTIHDVIYLDFPEYAPAGWRRRTSVLGSLSAWAARQITTVSEYSKSRITERFGVPADKISVVPNGLSQEWTDPDGAAIAAAWARLAPRVPDRFLLAVGRLDPRKNLPLSARVTRELRRLKLVDGLVVVGPDDFGGPAIRRAWAADGTAELVTHFSGLHTSELQALYAHASCLLFLSLAEGFGLPLLEAMAMGTPVVASNRTAMPEVCGDAACLVDPADEEAVVTATRSVLSDEAVRARFVDRGRSRVALYGSDRSARQMLEVYRRAAG
jgi:glycosyltransferase involved in cell wall biosynthesis